MTLFSVVGTKGSPGVTCISLKLAMRLSKENRETILFEFDRSGSDLSTYLSMSSRPGLVTLAAMRRNVDSESFNEHCQMFGDSLKILFGLPGMHQGNLIDLLMPSIREFIKQKPDSNFIFDLGRWNPEASCQQSIVEISDKVITVCNNSIHGISNLRQLIIRMKEMEMNTSLITTGDQIYDAQEIAEVVDSLPVGHIESPYLNIVQSSYIKNRIFNKRGNKQFDPHESILDLVIQSSVNSRKTLFNDSQDLSNVTYMESRSTCSDRPLTTNRIERGDTPYAKSAPPDIIQLPETKEDIVQIAVVDNSFDEILEKRKTLIRHNLGFDVDD